MIPFNRPDIFGNELSYITESIRNNMHISGNGPFARKCQKYFEDTYGFPKTLLTTSCTDALEMAAILLDIGNEDEVIVPSYTFVSTANAFALRGAKLRFADSTAGHPNVDPQSIEALINDSTKAIVVVHYAGNSCDMISIMNISEKYNIPVIEDAAQAFDSYHLNNSNRTPLGTYGTLATFSFHETKNIVCGEGGLLVINDIDLIRRAEVIWEKGTDRSAFFKGEVDKYGWVDLGSSFLLSDLNAAFLFGQLEKSEQIQNRRLQIWNTYYEALKNVCEKHNFGIHEIPEYSTNNAHIFYLIAPSEDKRNNFLSSLRKTGVHAVFHYQSLHKSPYILKQGLKEDDCKHSDYFSERLIRLPLYGGLTDDELQKIITNVKTTLSELG